MKLRLRDVAFQWVSFKYERLNTFCFCCGLIGHSDRFCRKVYEEGVEPKDYLYGVWMRVGIRRPPKPVGAKWLLADLPLEAVCVPTTPAIPVLNPLQTENTNVMQGDLKRRREGDQADQSALSSDLAMNDISKNLVLAGPVVQTRPSQ